MALKGRKLTAKQEMFCREYLVDMNAAAAAQRAAYKGKNLNKVGWELLQHPPVADLVQKLMAERAARVTITSDDVLRRWVAIATGDVTRLTKHQIGSCRYCWGENHEYQWRTEREYLEALLKTQNTLPEDSPIEAYPSNAGGYGYNLTRKPCPSCPECNGLGAPYVTFADTDMMSDIDKALFEGVEQGKDGIKYRLADRMRALEQIAKHLGMFKEQVEHDVSDPLRELLAQVQGVPMPIRKEGDE